MDAVNTHQVFEGLWTSGQLSLEDIQRLPGLGIDAVLNLALPTSPHALAGEADQVTALGLSYVQIPVPWEAPDPAHFDQFVAVLGAFEGRRLWVHCALNMRVSAFVYLYRRLVLGEGEEGARHPMREVWEPNEAWQGFIDTVVRRHASR